MPTTCNCRDLGIFQAAIRDLLDQTDQPERCCEAVTEIARSRLDQVNRRIAQITVLKAALAHMTGVCRGSRIPPCRIVETLAGPPHNDCTPSAPQDKDGV